MSLTTTVDRWCLHRRINLDDLGSRLAPSHPTITILLLLTIAVAQSPRPEGRRASRWGGLPTSAGVVLANVFVDWSSAWFSPFLASVRIRFGVRSHPRSCLLAVDGHVGVHVRVHDDDKGRGTLRDGVGCPHPRGSCWPTFSLIGSSAWFSRFLASIHICVRVCWPLMDRCWVLACWVVCRGRFHSIHWLVCDAH